MGRQSHIRQRRRPPQRWRWQAGIWRTRYWCRHHRYRFVGRLDFWHQSADYFGLAQWRPAGAGAARAGAAPAGGRPHGAICLHRAGGYRRCVERCFYPRRRALPAAQAGAVSRRHGHRLRPRPSGNGAVLLPGRPKGLHRLGLLRNAEKPARRAGRVCAGLRDCPRGRPPRAKPAGHQRQGRQPARARQPSAIQPTVGQAGIAGRLLCRRVGQPCASGAANFGKRRHRSRHERRRQNWRRRPAKAKPRPRGARQLYPRQQRPAGALV